MWTKNIKTVTQFDENAKEGKMGVAILFVAGAIFACIASYFRAKEEMEKDSEWWSSRNERRK